MITVTVYHPKHNEINGGYTVFRGEMLDWGVSEQGELTIADWETATEHGYATFARGAWTYICSSQNKS